MWTTWAHIHRNARRKLAIYGARVSPPLSADLLLDIHEAFLHPGTVLLVGADRISVQHFGESGFDLLVDFAQLMSVFKRRLEGV
jgi:hypothetical protein